MRRSSFLLARSQVSLIAKSRVMDVLTMDEGVSRGFVWLAALWIPAMVGSVERWYHMEWKHIETPGNRTRHASRSASPSIAGRDGCL